MIGIECEIGFRVNREFTERAPALWPRRNAGGILAASDDRGGRFALPGFPLARPAAGARRQFLERRAGLWRRRLGLAGDGSGASADRRDRRRQNTSPNAPGCAPATRSRCWSSWSILSRTGAAACPRARSSRPGRIPGWFSPNPAPIFAPIMARSGSSRCRFRDRSTYGSADGDRLTIARSWRPIKDRSMNRNDGVLSARRASALSSCRAGASAAGTGGGRIARDPDAGGAGRRRHAAAGRGAPAAGAGRGRNRSRSAAPAANCGC